MGDQTINYRDSKGRKQTPTHERMKKADDKAEKQAAIVIKGDMIANPPKPVGEEKAYLEKGNAEASSKDPAAIIQDSQRTAIEQGLGWHGEDEDL
jgi:hypothetical protein